MKEEGRVGEILKSKVPPHPPTPARERRCPRVGFIPASQAATAPSGRPRDPISTHWLAIREGRRCRLSGPATLRDHVQPCPGPSATLPRRTQFSRRPCPKKFPAAATLSRNAPADPAQRSKTDPARDFLPGTDPA